MATTGAWGQWASGWRIGRTSWKVRVAMGLQAAARGQVQAAARSPGVSGSQGAGASSSHYQQAAAMSSGSVAGQQTGAGAQGRAGVAALGSIASQCGMLAGVQVNISATSISQAGGSCAALQSVLCQHWLAMGFVAPTIRGVACTRTMLFLATEACADVGSLAEELARKVRGGMG